MAEQTNAISGYIAKQDAGRRAALEALYALLQKALPGATERIAWGMPSFQDGKAYIVHFQAFRDHINLYVGPEAVAYFQKRMPLYAFTLRGLQLPYDGPLPESEIRAIVTWCRERIQERAGAKHE